MPTGTMPEPNAAPVQDIRKTVHEVRSRAAEFAIDPAKVAMHHRGRHLAVGTERRAPPHCLSLSVGLCIEQIAHQAVFHLIQRP
ncbi:MAG: hypothetical protein ACKOYJ_06145 [Planctomycetia bacterium]